MPITALGVLSHLPFLQYFSVEYIKHHTTNSVIRWIVWFNTIAVKSRIILKNIYQDSILVKKIVNNISDISKTMKEFTHETPLKESENIWINVVAYGRENNSLLYDENYKYDISLPHLPENGELNDHILHDLVNVYNSYKEDVMKIYTTHCDDEDDDDDKNEIVSDKGSTKDTYPETETENGNPVLDEFMIIMKYFDRKLIRIHNIKKKDNAPITLNRSNVKFITVEYYHEEMEEPIELHLPKEYYIEGNHLFTPVSILMLLKEQSLPYYFDLNYKLYVIDKDVSMFQLNSNKYVLLGQEDYQVRDL